MLRRMCPRILLALTLLAAPPATAQEGGLLRVGEPLPAIELPTVDGRSSLLLSELVGTPTLLIEFASW